MPTPPAGLTDEQIAELEKRQAGGLSDADLAKLEAPPQNPTAGSAERFLQGLMSGAGSGLVSMVNPAEYVRGAAGAAELAGNLNPIANISDLIRGNKPGMVKVGEGAKALLEAIKSKGSTPEGAGELLGGALPAAIPWGGLITKLGAAEKFAKVAGISREGRVKNIANAIGAGKNDIADLTALEPTTNLPISLTRRSLAAKLGAATESAGDAVKAAEGPLIAASPTVPTEGIRTRMPIPEHTILAPGGEGNPGNLVTVSGSSKLARAMKNAERDITGGTKVVGEGEEARVVPKLTELPTNVAVNMKRQAQAEARAARAYQSADAGGVTAETAKAKGAALQGALEDLGTPEAAAFKEANKKFHDAAVLSDPIEAKLAAEAAAPMKSAVFSLTGRSLVPYVSGAAGNFLGGPAGAVAGYGVARFLQSPAWQTISAAGKAKLIPLLESGQVSKFQQEAMKLLILEHQMQQEKPQ